jgi:hypothetical protein
METVVQEPISTLIGCDSAIIMSNAQLSTWAVMSIGMSLRVQYQGESMDRYSWNGDQ